MSPTSQRWIGTSAILGAALVVVPVLKLAFREEAGAEAAALGVFMLLFIALLVIGLLMDSLWSSTAGETAELEYVTKAEWLTNP
jgi:hypothetical protein